MPGSDAGPSGPAYHTAYHTALDGKPLTKAEARSTHQRYIEASLQKFQAAHQSGSALNRPLCRCRRGIGFKPLTKAEARSTPSGRGFTASPPVSSRSPKRKRAQLRGYCKGDQQEFQAAHQSGSALNGPRTGLPSVRGFQAAHQSGSALNPSPRATSAPPRFKPLTKAEARSTSSPSEKLCDNGEVSSRSPKRKRAQPIPHESAARRGVSSRSPKRKRAQLGWSVILSSRRFKPLTKAEARSTYPLGRTGQAKNSGHCSTGRRHSCRPNRLCPKGVSQNRHFCGPDQGVEFVHTVTGAASARLSPCRRPALCRLSGRLSCCP